MNPLSIKLKEAIIRDPYRNGLMIDLKLLPEDKIAISSVLFAS